MISLSRMMNRSLLHLLVVAMAIFACVVLLAGMAVYRPYLWDLFHRLALQRAERDAFHLQSHFNREISQLKRVTGAYWGHDPGLAAAVAVCFDQGEDCLGPLRKRLDLSASRLRLDFLAIGDRRGRYLHGYGDPQRGEILSTGLERVVAGEEGLMFFDDAAGLWTVRAVSPLWQGKEVVGVIVAGYRMGDPFVSRVLGNRRSPFFIAREDGTFHFFRQDTEELPVDSALIRRSLRDKVAGHVFRHDRGTGYYYTPFQIVGATYVLVLPLRLDPAHLFMEGVDARFFVFMGVVLLLLMALGVAIHLVIIRPIRALRNKAMLLVQVGAGKGWGLSAMGEGERNEGRLLDRFFETVSVRIYAHIVNATGSKIPFQTLSIRDPLTGLGNQRHQEEELARLVSQCRRRAWKLGVIYTHINGLKEINERLHHDGGDRLLIEMASRFRSCLRESDGSFRIDGNTFVALLPGCHGARVAMAAATRIRDAIGLPFEIQGIQEEVSVSIGVSLFPDHGDDPDTLRQHALQALHAAQRAGGSACRLYPGI